MRLFHIRNCVYVSEINCRLVGTVVRVLLIKICVLKVTLLKNEPIMTVIVGTVVRVLLTNSKYNTLLHSVIVVVFVKPVKSTYPNVCICKYLRMRSKGGNYQSLNFIPLVDNHFIPLVDNQFKHET